MEKQPTDGVLEEFRVRCWDRLPNKGFFFVLLGAWVLLFHLVGNSTLGYVRTPSLLSWMYNAYNPPTEVPDVDDQFGMVVPFVVLGLFVWKGEKLVNLPLKTWWPALVLVMLGLAFHTLGYVIQQPRVSIIGMFTGIYGLMGVAWGPRFLRESFFPFCLLVFAVPLGTAAQPITFRLRVLVCKLVEWVCHSTLAIDVIRVGTALKDPTDHYQYEVAAACSGIRSLASISMMAIVYGFVSFPTWWKRAVMIGSAVPLAVLGNLLRMLMIVIAAEMGGQEWGNYIHDNLISIAGNKIPVPFNLVPYIPAILGLFMLAHFLEGKRKKSGTNSQKPDSAKTQNVASLPLPEEAKI